MKMKIFTCEECGSARMVNYRCDADWAGEVNRVNADEHYLENDIDYGESYDIKCSICLNCGKVYTLINGRSRL